MSLTTSHLDALGIRARLGKKSWSAPAPHGPDGWSYLKLDSAASVIVSCATYQDGLDWVHASIASDVMPSYADLQLLHHAVWPHGWAFQVFAPPQDHVNIHARALHLWGRLDGARIHPDFTFGTGSI